VTDPAIIEAAARALFEIMERLDPELDDPDWEKLTKDDQGFFSLCVTAVLKIVTPLIEAAALKREAIERFDINDWPLVRAAALEEAAKVAEAQPTHYPDADFSSTPHQFVKDQIAAAIRALKAQP